MSAEPSEKAAQVKGRRVATKLHRLRVSRRHGMFGMAEIVGLAGSALILLTVIFSYLYFMVPARSRLQSRQLERTRLQNQLRNSRDVAQQGLDTKSTVDKITDSLADFESNRLASVNQGRMGLYDELNQLIRKNGLRNTSGPAYTPLDPVGAKTITAASKSASTKWQSVYPGIGVTVTVEGAYQNLRRFTRDLEQGTQFIIINSIELERATETNSAAAGEGSSGSGSQGALVSLRLNMATYFQRDTVETSAQPTQ